MPKWYSYNWFIPSPRTKILQARYWPIQEDAQLKYLNAPKPHDTMGLHGLLDSLAPSGYTVMSYFAGDWGKDSISQQFTKYRPDPTMPGMLVLFTNPVEAQHCKDRWDSLYVLPRKLKGTFE